METMKVSDMKKILSKVYETDCKMDKALDELHDAMVNGDENRAMICQKERDRLCAILHGITLTLEALGYKLTDTDGYWKIVPNT